MKSPLRYLSVKLFLLLMAVMLVVFSIHTYINITATYTNLTDYVYASAHRASDLIARSTRHSMLLNRRDDVHEIINGVGDQPGFVAINIYNKNGEIITSTDSTKVGHKVDLNAEACNLCHATGEPLVSVPAASRLRDYQSTEHGHILGLINPIRNEAECSNAACHFHDPEQKILGVLDVKMSLASVDAGVAAARREMIVVSLVMTLLIAGISGAFIYTVVRKPIKLLKRGMTTVAEGNLDAKIDLNSDSEIGELALSFNTMASDLRSARDELHGWAATLEDRISEKTDELQQAQSQIIHMEKMASLGQLSASVAHEINNPLFGILTYAKLVQRELEDAEAVDEKLKRYVSVIQQESSRCGDIVKNLLSFARRTGGEFSQHGLNALIEQTLLLMAHHFEMQQISLKTELNAKDDSLVCDARQIQQAIIAPCMNAVEAMPNGGILTVTTSGDDDSVSVEIIDTGVGIPKDVVTKIFEPFFTTKEGTGESGLGLGLSVVYGIVQRHHGQVRVDSAPDKGTTFTIILPREHTSETPDERDPTRNREVAL